MIYHSLTPKHWLVLAVLAIAIILASINPLEYPSYMLHQIGTVLMLVALFFCLKKIGLSFSSFLLYILFLIIHVIAAHYLYSYVPYNDWSINIYTLTLTKPWDGHAICLIALYIFFMACFSTHFSIAFSKSGYQI